jgi:hypothetical protein
MAWSTVTGSAAQSPGSVYMSPTPIGGNGS